MCVCDRHTHDYVMALHHKYKHTHICIDRQVCGLGVCVCFCWFCDVFLDSREMFLFSYEFQNIFANATLQRLDLCTVLDIILGRGCLTHSLALALASAVEQQQLSLPLALFLFFFIFVRLGIRGAAEI